VHESTILSSPAPTCIAHPGAILLRGYWAVYNLPPPTSRVYALHHTLLVITKSCKGQILTYIPIHRVLLPTTTHRIYSCATPLQSRRAPVRVVLSGRWPDHLVGSRLKSKSAALGGSLGAATTTSTIKRHCAVARSVFV